MLNRIGNIVHILNASSIIVKRLNRNKRNLLLGGIRIFNQIRDRTFLWQILLELRLGGPLPFQHAKPGQRLLGLLLGLILARLGLVFRSFIGGITEIVDLGHLFQLPLFMQNRHHIRFFHIFHRNRNFGFGLFRFRKFWRHIHRLLHRIILLDLMRFYFTNGVNLIILIFLTMQITAISIFIVFIMIAIDTRQSPKRKQLGLVLRLTDIVRADIQPLRVDLPVILNIEEILRVLDVILIKLNGLGGDQVFKVAQFVELFLHKLIGIARGDLLLALDLLELGKSYGTQIEQNK